MNFSRSTVPVPLSIIYAIFVTVLAIVSLPQQTSSAPTKKLDTKTNNETFTSELLSFVKNRSCIFPLESDVNANRAFFTKIDSICGNRSSSQSQSHELWLCIAIADVVDKICNVTKESPILLQKKDQVKVPLKEDIESEKESSVFCEGFVKSEDTPPQNELPKEIQNPYGNFLVKSKKDAEAAYCSAVCENHPVKEIKEDENLKVNPLCILFKKGYTVLNALQNLQSDEKEKNRNEPSTGVGSVAAGVERVHASQTDSFKKEGGNDNSNSSPNSNAVAESSEKPKQENAQSEHKDDKDAALSQPEVSEDPLLAKPNSEDIVSGKLIASSSYAPKVSESSKSNAQMLVVSSSTSTTSTPSSVNIPVSANDDEVEPPPLAAGIDRNSPSPAPKEGKDTKAEDEKVLKEKTNDDNKKLTSEKTKNEDIPIENNDYSDDVDPFQSGKINDEDNFNLDTAGDNQDSKKDSITVSKTKYSGRNKDVLVETVQVEKAGGTGNINIAYTESSDPDDGGGVFNYFLFFLTFLALGFLVFHNKRRLLAYVVEGRKPRGSRVRRRSSSGASYRRLENNFE